MSSSPVDGRGDWRPRAVFLTLAAVYWLLFSGRFHSADEESTLAMVESMVKRGRFDTPQRVFAVQIGLPITQETIGRGGYLYSKRGWSWATVVAPFYALSLLSERLGGVYTAYLATVVITALGGSWVYVCGRELGYGARASLWGSLSFGLGTIALVYARFLFAEPFIGLCLLGGIWGALRYRRWGAGRWAALAGFMVGLGGGARVATLALWPVFALYVCLVAVRSKGWRAALEGLAAVIMGGALPVALSGAYNWVRFGNVWQSGYTSAAEGFTTPIGVGLYGLWLSAGKGFFWFSPILLLALPGTAMVWRKRWAEVALLWGLCAVTALTYAAWYMWWGGSVWGPRFLVPLSGPMSLLIVPVWEWAWRRRWRVAVVGALFLLSVAVQVVGGAVDFLEYGAELTALDPHAEWTIGIYEWRYQPVWGHLRLLLAGHLDLAWARLKGSGGDVDGLLLVVDAAAFIGCVLALAAGERGWRWWPLLLVLWMGTVLGGEMRLQGALLADPQARAWRDLYWHVAENALSGDLLFVQDEWGGELGYALDTSRLPRYVWSARPIPLDARSARWVSGFVGRRVWLASGATAAQDRLWGIERWLAEHGARVTDVEFGEGLRLVCFARLPPLARVVAGYRFGEAVVLYEYARTVGPVAPGDSVYIRLTWFSRARPDFDYSVFVHLVDAQGRLYRQIDGSPVSGFCPMSTWSPGKVVVDRYGLVLPNDCPTGVYHLIVGVYRWDTLERLPVVDADGHKLGDAVELGELVVEERE